MIPWTLQRDPKRVGLLRTWVCTACQLVEEAVGVGLQPPHLAAAGGVGEEMGGQVEEGGGGGWEAAE